MVLWNPDRRALALRKSQEQYQGRVVPHLVLVFWELTGLLSYPFRSFKRSTILHSLKWIYKIWWLIILLTYTYFAAMEIALFTRVFRVDLDKLEFFILINFIDREFYFLLPIFTLLVLGWQSSAIPTLLHLIDGTVHDILDQSKIKLVRLFHYVSLLWTIAVMVTSAFCGYHGMAQMKLMLADMMAPSIVTWDSARPSPLLGGSTTLRVTAITYTIAHVFAVLCWLAPHLLLCGLVLTVGLAFHKVNSSLEIIRGQCLAETAANRYSEVVVDIGLAKMRHRRLRDVLDDLNAVFKNIVLLATLGDIIVPVALISRMLQKALPDDDHAHRKHFELQDEAQKYTLLFFSACAIVESVSRVVLMVWMHEQAENTSLILHGIHMHGRNHFIVEGARNFQHEIEEHPKGLGIGGNGYFTINRHFAATILGIIFTYFLLVYEQTDQKGDLNTLKYELKEDVIMLKHQLDRLADMINSTRGPNH